MSLEQNLEGTEASQDLNPGTIYVNGSLQTSGAKIEFAIPYAHSKPSYPSENFGPNKGTTRILYVDDDSVFVGIQKVRLEHIMGFPTDTATSGQAALDLMDKNQYQLIIADETMPQMSGFELALKIKEKNFSGKVAIISGWGDHVSLEEKERCGVSYVREKPLSFQGLKELVRQAIPY
jgi:CheY-like chemotaxis protein